MKTGYWIAIIVLVAILAFFIGRGTNRVDPEVISRANNYDTLVASYESLLEDNESQATNYENVIREAISSLSAVLPKEVDNTFSVQE